MYCSDCGMPRGIGKANDWKPSGIIVSKYEQDLRGIFYDVGELDHLFISLSETIGYDVTRLVVEGKRKDSAHYTRGLLRSIEKSGAALPEPEEFFRIMAANFAVPGFGKVNIISYREDEGIVMDMECVYSVPMAQGQAAGVFEAVVNRRGDVNWEGDARHGRVTVAVREGEPELERRIASEVEAAEPLAEDGDREYELCARCSVPLELGRCFSWEVEKASITERRSGRRFIFDNTRGIAAVMRVLVEELGEDVERTLAEISRVYARDYYQALGGGFSMKEEFARLALWGWGLPRDAGGSGEGYSLEIVNPFYEPVMAGRIWGLAEAASGKALGLASLHQDGGISYLELSAA
ncbi:MAG: hypothetical protein AB1384_12260 [Actinomycetota bacterium]